MLCDHRNKQLVWSTLGSGGYPIERQLRWQCRACGCLLKNAVAYSMAKFDTPDVDAVSLKRYLESDQPPVQSIANEKIRKEIREKWKAERKVELRQKYAWYLETAEWREKHRLVMLRAGGVCEGCLVRQATQVHHLTYENIGEEFLWQLVAVCRTCHERYHEIG